MQRGRRRRRSRGRSNRSPETLHPIAHKPFLSPSTPDRVRSWMTLAIAAAITSGCLADPSGGPASATPRFQRYADCAAAIDEAFAASCDDLHGAKYETADWHDAVPSGWECVGSADFRDERPETPAWWFYTRPVQDDVVQSVAPTRLQLGLAYDVDGIGEGPVDGVAQVFSHEQPIRRWLGLPGHGFVILGEIGANDEIEVDGIVTDVVLPGPASPFPSFRGDKPSVTPDSSVNATGVDVEYVGTDWGRQSIQGSYPRLWATQVVEIEGAQRFLPANEMPGDRSGDPKQYAGSAHWHTNPEAHSIWTNVTDGGARIVLHQAVRLRFDLHIQDIGTPPGCVSCPALLGDPVEGALCIVEQVEPVHPSPANLHLPRPAYSPDSPLG